jgi:predicted LPLAT superfamily acyltransferase
VTQTKQRGSGWSIKLAMNLYKLLGYRVLYYAMYPTAFFYFLVASNVKEALRDYYKTIGITFNNKVYYEHLRVFAICLVDRFVTKVDPENYNFEYDDIETPKKILSSGSILIYSHFGGWAASSSGVHVSNKINMVMEEAMIEGIRKIEDTMEIESQLNIIDVNKGTIHVSIEIANALMNDEVVAIMADRASNEKAEMEMPFFNKLAPFNKNPFQVAYKVNKPILAYFIVLTGMQRYKVEYIHIKMDKNKKENEAVEEALLNYIEKFEEIIKAYPNQWFNLYKFWEKK